MKKLGILMAVAMLFAGTATFAATPSKTVKQGTQQAATTKTAKTHKAHKGHKKHHSKKAATTSAPAAK